MGYTCTLPGGGEWWENRDMGLYAAREMLTAPVNLDEIM